MHVQICKYIAVCRHGIVLSATNFYKVGERYAFAQFMLATSPLLRDLKVVHLDVGCKFGPWLNRVNDSIAKSTDKAITESTAYANSVDAINQMIKIGLIVCLAEWHGNNHSAICQVRLNTIHEWACGICLHRVLH